MAAKQAGGVGAQLTHDCGISGSPRAAMRGSVRVGESGKEPEREGGGAGFRGRFWREEPVRGVAMEGRSSGVCGGSRQRGIVSRKIRSMRKSMGVLCFRVPLLLTFVGSGEF